MELVGRLRDAGGDPTPRELAESLWLARWVGTGCGGVAGEGADRGGHVPAGPPPGTRSASPEPPPPGTGAPLPERLPLHPAHHPGAGQGVPAGGRAPFPVRAPGATALPDPLPMQRALRPLRRYRPPVHVALQQLDEQATAERAAVSGLLLPVLQDSGRREARLQLLMDVSTSTAVWTATLTDLRRLCEGTGVFREVLVHYVHMDDSGAATVSRDWDPGRRPRAPELLRDPTGRQLTLVLSDCAGPLWRTGRMQRLLHRWSRTSPVAVVQPLPQRMWGRTHLPASAGLLRRREGLGGRLEFRQSDGGGGGGRDGAYGQDARVPVPVLAPTPAALETWARLMSGTTGVSLPAAAGWVQADHPSAGPRPAPGEADPGRLVRTFRQTASRPALELAVALSAVPLTLPVMRMVQRATQPRSGPSVLAEVVLSGLLRRGESEGWYEFAPGVREALLRVLPKGDALMVLRLCSAYVEQHFGRGTRNFPALALARLAEGEGAPELSGGAENDAFPALPEPFAEIPAQVVRRYAPRAPLASTPTEVPTEPGAEFRIEPGWEAGALPEFRIEPGAEPEPEVEFEIEFEPDAEASRPGLVERARRRLLGRTPHREPEPVPEPEPEPEPVQSQQLITVVFPGPDRAWAAWIARTLEAHGQRTSLHRWDPPREQDLTEALGDLLLTSGPVLLVLSERFFQLGPRREGEWDEALRGLVARNAGRFAAVALTDLPLSTAAALLEPVDLRGLDATEAERRLLARLDLEATPRENPNPRELVGARYPNDPPAVWGGVPRRNPRFTGRDELLARVQRTLMDAEPGASVCALVGMAGIGKTQVAVEYAHRYGSDYDVVWWIDADRRATLRERLAELAAALDLDTGPEIGERVRAVREALRTGEPYRRWLLVLDGWEEPEGADGLLPQGSPGHVLITSRNRAWRTSAEVVEMPGFDRAESTGYLLRRAPHLSADEAEEVAAELGDLPLALTQAASVLAESRMDAAEYLRRLRDGTTDLEGSEATLAAWSLVLNQLRASAPSSYALLRLCAAFAPGRIPIGLVSGLPAAELPESLRWIVSEPQGWARALDTLVGYSVLTRERPGGFPDGPDAQQEAVRMHPVVHSMIGRLTGDEDRAAYRAVALRALTEADPGEPEVPRQWPRYAALLPHLGPSGATRGTDTRARGLVLNCLRYCASSGAFRDGAELAARVRQEWATAMAQDARPMLDLTVVQGDLLRALGRFREAYDLDTGALRRKGSARADPLARLTLESRHLTDLRLQGRYARAHAEQSELVSETLRTLRPEHPFAMEARHGLGSGLRLLGHYEEAYRNDMETLHTRQETLGARHPATLESAHACARDQLLMGFPHEAEERQKIALQLHESALGPEHPMTLSARHTLLRCRRHSGADGGPRGLGPQLAPLVAEHQGRYGPHAAATLAVMTDYGNHLRERGELTLARDLVKEAGDGYRELLGQAHPVVTAMLTNQGLVRRDLGDEAGALNLFEQALAGLRTPLGDDHPWTLGCALNAAGGRDRTGRPTEAYELTRDTLRRAQTTLGDDHPLTLSCGIALAADLRALREPEEAARAEEDTLRRMSRSLGAQHPDTLAARQRERPYWNFEPFLW
ncbi:FxSxx-COOH system tetratricopeptide repeat protein [Streptomyces daliensis]